MHLHQMTMSLISMKIRFVFTASVRLRFPIFFPNHMLLIAVHCFDSLCESANQILLFAMLAYDNVTQYEAVYTDEEIKRRIKNFKKEKRRKVRRLFLSILVSATLWPAIVSLSFSV